jgi:tetratricopeptide (TPR) repeat protein
MVAKKHKQHQQVLNSPAVLRPRLERARSEGRSQQALELSRQLYKYEPTAANLALLRQAYLERARQLRGQGQTRDAATTVEAALRLENPPPEWLELAAAELAHCGATAQALALLARIPESPGASRVRGHVVDAVLGNPGREGLAALPEAVRADLKAILQAFQLTEKGDDEGARAALQPIGLRSPVLEWRLLLRGLQAYYHNDDARAVENWQRLDPERLPARLAAPFRARIDRSFQAAQPPGLQATLQRQWDALQGEPLGQRLRGLRSALANQHSLAQAFRQLESLLPQLRQDAPALVPRLASCLYWATLDTGPDDLLRYQRVFGPPRDDPSFHRLRALAYERAGELQQAQHSWEQFEKEIAARPEVWPGEQGTRARALVWLRMGHNAVRAGRQDDNPLAVPWIDFPTSHRLKPGADHCLRRSRELAPDLLEAYEALLDYHLEEDHPAKAEQAARELLKRFADHARALEELSDLRKERGDTAEALRLMQQALHANPLDRGLRQRVAFAHGEQARSLILAGQFDEARRELQSAAAFDVEVGGWLHGLQAALEFKAKNPAAAEEALARAAQVCRPAVVLAYVMLVEASRLKLPPAVKKRFDQDFKSGLEGPTDARAATGLLRYVRALQEDGVTYHGQKTHTKKILDYAQRTAQGEPAEEALGQVAGLLIDLEAYRPALSLARAGQEKFPTNPYFLYLEALARVRDDNRSFQPWRIDTLLTEAERQVRARPGDPALAGLLDQIQACRQELAEQDPLGATFRRAFEMGGADDDFEDDSFYDE